jgi:HK97 family phage major capsid protein
MNLEKKQLLDKKGSIVSQMEASFAEVRKRTDKTPTADENRQFDAWDAELVQVDERIAFLEREDKVKAMKVAEDGVRVEHDEQKEKRFAGADIATQEKRAEVFAKANKHGFTALDEEERSVYNTIERDSRVFNIWMRHGFDALSVEERTILNARKATPEKRAQSVGTTTAGGYTVPEGFSGRIIEKMKFISQLLNWANIMDTATGNLIPFPINDDTSNTGELIGENADLSSSSADLVFSVYNLSAYKFSSKMIKVSSELLQDNGVNLEAYLAKKLAERVARITNSYFTTGTGSSQPQGYITGASQGFVLGASATAFTSSELITFQDSLDQAYQNNPKVAFAMHQLVLNAIKKLTIGTNYNSQLWVPSFREGAPNTILGKPYFLNNAMASTLATGNKVIAYGDWDNFTIRRVNDFSLRRLSERYAEFDQTAFFGLARMDSFVEDSSAIKYFEMT